MRRGLLTTATTLTALGLLAACDNPDADRGAAARVCTPFAEAPAAGAAAPGQVAPAAAADPAAAVDDCLHRWGYTLAAASDTADTVAQATVAACTPALSRWNQQGLAAGAAPQQPGAPLQTAPSMLTGEPTNPFAEHYSYARARALFYVVQARAGKCAPPPTRAPKG
jgi:hypothetical protein